ncbi:MAG: hypothetical protein JSW55_00965, partial [Chloroflexota bacterium]
MNMRYLIIPTILILLLLVACTGQEGQEMQPTEQMTSQDAETPEGTPTEGGTPSDGGEEAGGADSEEILATRAPEPTGTPGP